MQNHRALLDKLMGRDRNMDDDEREENRRNHMFKRWDDEKICPYYLCGLCPHDLFFNTKCDLGKCQLDHDDNAYYDFSRQRSETKQEIEKEAFDFYKSMMKRVENWIKYTNQRIEKAQDDVEIDEQEYLEERRQLVKDEITKQKGLIKNTEKEIKRLGETGQIDLAKNLVLLSEKMKTQLERLNEAQIYKTTFLACEVCGGQTIHKGTKLRQELHTQGRRHQGFLKIRERIEAMRHLKHLRSHSRDSSASKRSRTRSYSRKRAHENKSERRSSSSDRGSRDSQTSSDSSRSCSVSRTRWSSSSRSRSRSHSPSIPKRKRSFSSSDYSHEPKPKVPKTIEKKKDGLQFKTSRLIANVTDIPQNKGLEVIVNLKDGSERKAQKITVQGKYEAQSRAQKWSSSSRSRSRSPSRSTPKRTRSFSDSDESYEPKPRVPKTVKKKKDRPQLKAPKLIANVADVSYNMTPEVIVNRTDGSERKAQTFPLKGTDEPRRNTRTFRLTCEEGFTLSINPE